jgi:phosphate transport system permease protein
MDSTPTFTGRTRRRRSNPWVRAGDAIARAVITLGGIGTIVAVLLVGCFLFAVALPLLRGSRVGASAGRPADLEAPAAIGSDESGAVAWVLESPRDGTTGGAVNVVGVADGTRFLSRSAADCGLENAAAVRIVPGGMLAAVGYADGSLRTGRIGLESTFLSEDPPAEARSLQVGRAIAAGDAIVVRTGADTFARVVLVTSLGEPSRALVGRIVDVDVVQLTDGMLAAAIDAGGRVRIEKSTVKRNMLTGRDTTRTTGATLDAEPEFRPAFVRVSELGDQLFLIATDGAARRCVIRDVEQPQMMETFRVTADGRGVAAIERLFGGTSLAVADTAGDVQVFFAVKRDGAKTDDNLSMVAAKRFPAEAPGGNRQPRATAIAASPRSRLFAVAEADGDADAGVRFLQATTGAEALRIPAGAGRPPVRTACITPREDALLTAGAGALGAWRLEVPHADVSLGALLRPLWYENFPGPAHVWETTGHESFESKYGLVPLIFGTIKATVYAMLFATPIALLAAIYASQFMHPRWKARIKPTIEMMASLPSVVLGFMAGLVFAPILARWLMPVITGLFAVPLTLLTAAHVWQILPAGARVRLAPWRLPIVGLVALPAGVAFANALAPWVERLLFKGDVIAWLNGRGGSAAGGWFIAALPLAAVAVAAGVGRFVNPAIRRASQGWSQPQAAAVAFAVFAGGVLAAALLAAAVAIQFDVLGWDIRGGLLGKYEQKNSLLVAAGMSFAIIPLVFTIADDALTSVPDHLRSASLGAGATPWQTAVRVILPAAASGIFSAVMIGLGRAVGETMIVLMAAGNTPIMDWNVFTGFETLSAAIATELPEAARNSTHYRVLFVAALALFAITFLVNSAAELVRQRFRRRAHEL